MGKYQPYKGNSENKLFYLIDQLDGGINTDFSDDSSSDNEFKSIVNFTMDKRGSLFKRKGFGKLNAVSEIFDLFDNIPQVRYKTAEYPNPEDYNDNIVYMKMLINDNNCFRNLSAFTGEKAYRDYQRLYGSLNNKFKLLFITTSKQENKSKAWVLTCKLPPLSYNSKGEELEEDTIELTSNVIEMPILFNWNRNLSNIDTIEFFDKIYFTNNNKGIACFDRKNDTFTYYGSNINGQTNNAYKPSPMEVRKVGFNILGDDPLHWIDYQGLTTDSIQGIYLTTYDNKPTTVIPSGLKFRLNILYTGNDSGFNITFKEGEYERSANVVENAQISTSGLKVYDVSFKTNPTSNVEIKIEKKEANINAYYDYYDVGAVDQEIKQIENINIGDYGILEMYNRAVYYKDDTIWFSELNNFNYIPNYNYVSLPIEPTDKITKIVYFRNVYVIFTKFRIYKMVGAFGDSNFEVTPLNLSMGCHAPNTIIPIENVLYFASPRGIYQLISSAAYGTSANSLTFENVKEIDTKVKSLTSNVTMYLGELTDPAIRYNGISENAYAFRYKDKYMLFFNTTFEQGDLAGMSNIDVLVYHYDIKAFTEMRFPVKPTFIFMVDGAIETFCSIPQKENYTEEETLFAYDFENEQIVNNVVNDLSGNNLDANIVGNLYQNPGVGIKVKDNNSYIKIGSINSEQNLNNGLEINMKTKINQSSGGKLFDLKQSIATSEIDKQNFSIFTDWSNGYRGEIICSTNPDSVNIKTTINYVLRIHRDNTSRNASQKVKFKLVSGLYDDITLIPEKEFSFNLGSNLYQDLGSGSFDVQHDYDGTYYSNWKLIMSSSYPTYSSRWINGQATTFDVLQNADFSSYFGIRVKGTITANNGSITVDYTPYFVTKKGASLSIGARTLTVNINGNNRTHSVAAIKTNGSSRHDYSGGSQSETFSYTGSGKNIFIDAVFNIRAKINGTYRENANIDGFNVAIPATYQENITTWNNFSTNGSSAITLNRIYGTSFKHISIGIYGTTGHNLSVVSESNKNSQMIIAENQNINIYDEHNWSFKYEVSGYDMYVTIKADDELFSKIHMPSECYVNSSRDACVIMDNIVGDIYNFDLSIGNNKIMSYNFIEGSGTTIIDKSGNSLNGLLVNSCEWILDKGLKFDGNGYIVIPQLKSTIPLSNGFTIEYEAKFNDTSKASRVLDLATGYDTGQSNLLKCSINTGIKANTNKIEFLSSSVYNKSYKVVSDTIDLKSKNKYKMEFIDNGNGYDARLYINNIKVSETTFNKGGISNILRTSNFIGKSNNPLDSLFTGMLYNMKITINVSQNPEPIYVGAMFEYDTTYDDFGEAMEIELETKGINLQYPMHQKKLKNLFVKGLGGYSYNEFFLEIYADGHLVNDPKTYKCYLDEVTHSVIYDYTETKLLDFNEKVSLLGNMRLSHTRLGESDYETRKIIVPSCKAKNIVVKIYGESADYLSIESLGFTFKLGKVKED